MKKLSKKLSLIVCIAMIANLFVFAAPSVLAADSGAEVLYKSSFSDYTSNGSPRGWVKTKYILQNNEEVENTSSAISALSEDEHNNFIQFKDTVSEVRDVIPFGKMISDGKIHISYDAKVPESEKNTTSNGASSVAVLFNARYNSGYYNNGSNGTKVSPFDDYNPYDASDLRGGNGRQLSHLFKVLYKDHNKYVSNAGGEKWGLGQTVGTTPVQNNVWYHTDLIVDVDNAVYDAWVDGEKLTEQSIELKTDDGANVYKGFSFLQQDGNKIGHYDNVVITHYKTNDTIQMVADAGKNGIGADSSDGKLLNVSFNDTLKYDFRDIDFKITAADGSEVTGVKVSDTNKTKSGCVLDFSAANGLKGNTDYTVTYKANNEGVATEVDAYDASATFRTNAEVVDTSAAGYKYYYAKEDFDDYTSPEQLPLGVYNFAYLADNYSEQYNKYLSNVGVNNTRTKVVSGVEGNAMRVVGSSSPINYYFPRGVITGNFTAEFDLRYNTGDWAIGFMPHINWMDKAIEKSSALGNFRYNNALIGISSKHGKPNLAIDAQKNDSGSLADMKHDYVKDTGLDVAEDEWAHIKLDFDMADGRVDIFVTDAKGNTTSALDQSYGDWNKFGMGIDGLQISKNKSYDENKHEITSAYLDIDNLEVYTNSARLLDQDFNGYNVNSNARYPYFWASDSSIQSLYGAITVNPAAVKPIDGRNAKSAPGKDGGTGDNAVEFYREKKDTAWYMTRFGRTVPAGQSYAVEFDLKYKDDNTAWIMGIIDPERSDRLIGYNNDNGNSKYGMTNTAVIASYKGNVFRYNKDKYVQTWGNGEAFTEGNGYKKLNGDTAVTTKEKWSHFKLVAIPQANNTQYTLTVDGNSYTFTDNSALATSTKAVAGISFRNGAQNETVTEEYGAIFLDNVKAYLCDSTGAEITKAHENSILSIEAEKLNGDTVSLTDTDKIPYSTKKITVTFSENLKETLKKDLSPISLVSGTTTAETTAVYDCIEDVIQLRSKNAAYPMDYDSQIDGNKFIITLKDALTDETTYSLHIAKNVGFESSPYSTLDKGFSRTYTGAVDTDGGFKLTKCEAGITDGSTWKAVAAYSDITGNEDKLGLKFNLTNLTGVDKNIRAIAAFYDESGAVSKLVNVSFADYTFETNGSAYEQIVPITVPTLAEGESYTTVRFFAWDADSQAPLKNPQEFINK